MNGPMTSIIGSIALAAATFIAGWLASHNIIPTADVTKDTALICTAIVGALGAGFVWFKAHMATASSHIAAVNAIPGIKVVAENATAQTVTAPPKA